MRAHSRKPSAGSIAILVDNEYPVAGSKVIGSILLDQSSETSADFDICLTFHGEEVAIVATYSGRAGATFEEKATCDIISLTLPSMEDDQFYDEYQYEAPFDFVLPAWLPPTMICLGEEKSRCGVRYWIEANVLFANKVGGKKHQLRETREVVVLGEMTYNQIPSQLRPERIEEQYQVYSFFCFPKGMIRVHGNLSSSAVRIGGNLVLDLGICNETKASIEYIHVKLMEYIRWQIRSDSGMLQVEKAKRILAERSLHPRRMVRDNRPVGKYSSHVNSHGKYNALFNIQMDVPYHGRCTYENLTLLSVEHVVCITLKLEGFSSLMTQPELIMPLTLLPPNDNNMLIQGMHKKQSAMVRETVGGHELRKDEPMSKYKNPLFSPAAGRRQLQKDL